MLQIKLKEYNGVLTPFLDIDGEEILLENVQSYKLCANVDELPRITLELQTGVADDYILKASDYPIPRASFIINDIEYEMQPISFLKYMKMVEGIKSIWNDLDKEVQEKFIKNTVEHGNYAKLRRYLEA